MKKMLLADDLNELLTVLPIYIGNSIKAHPQREQLIEIVLDIGRRPEARFANNTDYLSYRTVVWQDLDYILKRLGKFSGDNRAGIEKTLHRISSLRNRQGSVIGLTCRIGRAFFGTVSIVRDLLEIGCGTGYVTRSLKEHFPEAKITAVDIAPGMIEYVKSTIPNADIEFVCGDVEEMVLSEEYDLIISNATFQWFNHFDKTVGKLIGQLGEDGHDKQTLIGDIDGISLKT